MKEEAIKIVKKYFKITESLDKSKEAAKVDLKNTISALLETIAHEDADWYKDVLNSIEVINLEDIS